jgi:hypothetical protein
MLNRKPLIWFLIIAFSLAWVLFLLPLALGSRGSTTRQIAPQVLWALAMWAPGLGAIIATRWIAGERLRTLNIRHWAIGALPVGLVVVPLAVALACSPGPSGPGSWMASLPLSKILWRRSRAVNRSRRD